MVRTLEASKMESMTLKENIRRVKTGKRLRVEENPVKRRTKKAAKPRRRNRTIIKRAKRVIVLNGKKRAAKKRNAHSVAAKLRRRKQATKNSTPARPARRRKLAHKKTVAKSRPTISRRRNARGPKKRRNIGTPSPKVRALREKFTGMKSSRSSMMTAPDGTPKNLAKLGRVVSIKAQRKTIRPSRKNPASAVWLCADAKDRLHLCTTGARLIDGPAKSFGEVREIEYETAKPHLGHKRQTIFFHKMGEEGGRRPELIADGRGGLKFKGGDYTIESEGIRN